MRLGLGLSLASTGGGGVAAVDPTTLSLEGFWRDYGGASPWTGTASAGGSGSRSLTEATNPPSAGTALNGHGVADFDGTNDTFAGTNASTFFTSTAGSAWALVFVDAINTNAADSGAGNNDAIWADTGSIVGMHLKSTTPRAQSYFDDSAAAVHTASDAISTGAWVFIQQRWGASNVEIRINGGAWVVVSAGTGTLHASWGTIRVGRNFASDFFDGKMAELAFTNTRLSDATFDGVLASTRTRYALSL